MFERYAIFYTPSADAFERFGASWLGWDSATSRPIVPPQMDGIDVAELTKTPRKYGFHGTLKAPFHLAPGKTERDLMQAMQDFAQQHASAKTQGLTLQAHHGFVALHPAGPSTALNTLAEKIVRHFDIFRAPLTPFDLARRRKSGLSPQQDAYLLQWGYPYVMTQFRFHLTLTGAMAPPDAQKLITRLHPVVAPILPQPFVIDDLTLLGQTPDGFFHQIDRYHLWGGAPGHAGPDL